MRFFLRIKENGKQIGVKRIDSKHQLLSTDELITLIQKSINFDSPTFFIRLISDQRRLRIIPGWTLSHYNIRSGLQLQVQLLNTGKKSMSQIEKNENQLTGQVLFNKKKMDKIIQQQQEDDAEKPSNISRLVEKKYQQLLKLIQQNNTEAYFKQLKSDHPQLGQCQNQFYRKQLYGIQNQLGEKGWAAIHYSVYTGNIQILKFLISIGVDVNLKSSDQWLPIQLAIKEQKNGVLDILISQPNLNINICTGQGLALNLAVQSSNITLVAKILMKDVNFSARDHKNRTVYDMLGVNPNKQILDLLNMQQRRQSLTSMNNDILYHTGISSYRGEVLYIRTPPRKNKQYYICINPYETSLKIYEDKTHYPEFPKQIIPMSLVNKFKELTKSEISWYMSKDLFYFCLATPKVKYVFGCHFKRTVSKWIQVFQQCQEHVAMYPDSISQFHRNETAILDRVQIEPDPKSKKTKSYKDDLLTLFTSQASSSQTSQSPQKKSPLRAENNYSGKGSSGKKENNVAEKVKNEKKVEQESENNKKINLANQKEEERKKDTSSQQKAQEHQKVQPISGKNSLKYEDFKILKVLGEGSFGTVFMAMDVRNPEKKKHYAIKCFKKKKLVVNKQIKYTIAEVNILKQLQHPFIVNLHFAFQTPNYVYLGLDYCPNKDLSHHLASQVTFPQKDAMLYAAQILLALEYLHQKNIIYRDLKPQNIMLDQKGHVKLVDFGLSKQGQDRDFVAKSFCGSPAYLSPEMLVKKGVGKESDFYCLGAVLYEMIVGQPPFFSEDINTLYSNISYSKLTFPKGISRQVKDLLVGLLQRNPQKRLGYKGTEQIKNHQFFRDIVWEELLKKQAMAPRREQMQQFHEQDQIHLQDIHKDFDYSIQNYKINRFLNFSFVREDIDKQS